MPLAGALLLLVLMIPLVLMIMRANELFCLAIEGERVRVKRGRVPPALVRDISDILRAPPAPRGTLRGVVEDRRLRLYIDVPITEAQRQQLRNVSSMWPVAKIRNSPRAK